MTEHEEQVALMQMVEIYKSRFPELGLLFAVPNGGNRNIVTAKKLKAEGVKRGVPDLCLPVPRKGFHGLFIEMKKQKGGTVSKDQADWIGNLQDQGYKACVCKGAMHAWEVIKDYVIA